MLIGELAAETGTTTRALRYYEEQGLLTSERTGAGYRRYDPGSVLRVRNIRELLASGFTIDDVKSFVRYLDADLPEIFGTSPSCAHANLVGAQRLADLNARIATLTRLRDTLAHRMPWLSPTAEFKP